MRLLLRRICVLAGIGWLTGIFCPAFLPNLKAAPADSAPNIIVILVDDMGYADLGCFGSEIHTPNIDALAEHGLRFTQFYNAARCSPTRASLMTGLYPHEADMGWLNSDWGHPGYRGDLNRSCVTIAQVLKPAGYSAYMSGKWHLTSQVGYWTGNKERTSKHNWPRQRGFDRFFGILDGTASFYNPLDLVRDNEPIAPPDQPFYLTDGITDNAIEFIQQHAKEKANSPFFLYLAYNAPHFPNHALPEDIARYNGVYDKGWDELRAERYKRMLEIGILNPRWSFTPRDPEVEPWESVEHKAWQARRMQAYAAQIDRVDQGVGRLVATLRESKKLSNTLIFFLSDNGGTAEELRADWPGKPSWMPVEAPGGEAIRYGNNPAIMPGPADNFQSYGRPWANLSNVPFRMYKKWVHEGGISTPLIVHWPAGLKAQAGSLTSQPGHLVDIMATAIDVSGASYPEQIQGEKLTPFRGESLLPILQGGERQRGPIYWEHEGNRAVRDGKWKLVSKYDDPWELYDLEADRTETMDLAAKEPDRVQRMKQLYNDWAARSNVAPWKLPWQVINVFPVTTEYGYGHVTGALPPKQ